MGNAVRDENHVTSWLGVSSADGVTPLPVLIDPVTGRVLVEAPGGGGGDVVGPLSSTDNAIAKFDGVTGLVIQESIIILSDAGTLASTGQLGFSDQWQSGSTYGTDLVLADASAEWDDFETNFGEVSLLNAFNQLAAGGVGSNTLDQAYDEGGAGAGRAITADSGAVTITVPDTSNNEALVLTGNDTTNNPTVLEVVDAGDQVAVLIDKNADGIAFRINMDSNSAQPSYGANVNVNGLGTGQISGGVYDIKYSGGGTLVAAYAFLARVGSFGAGTITYANCINVQILEDSGSIVNATAFNLLNHTGTPTNTYLFTLTPASSWKSGTYSFPVLDDTTTRYIPMTDAITGLTRDSEDLVFQTTTSGDIHLLAATDLVLSDGNQSGSTYASELILSDNSTEWDDFETNFGEVSILNAFNQLAGGGAGGNTLDQAYDEGGAGAGRAIDVDSGAIQMTVSNTDNNAVLELIQNDVTNNPVALSIANTGTGPDIELGNGIINNTSADIVIQTTTSGDVQLLATTDLVFSDGNKSGSTYASELVLSDASAEWDSFETNFGEVSILNAMNQNASNIATNTADIATNTADIATNTAAIAAIDYNTLDEAYDQGGAGAGRAITADSGAVTITVPDTSNNAALELTNNDTTNDPITASITNNAANDALYINQVGVLDANKAAVYIYSNAAQTNAYGSLLYVFNDNASTDQRNIYVEQDGTGGGIYIKQNGVLSAARQALYVYTDAIQINEALVRFFSDNASSTTGVLELENDGTGTNLYVQQDGVLAATKYALHVYSNAAQVNAYLAYIHSDNASSSYDVAGILNDGTGSCLYLYQSNDASNPALDIFTASTIGVDISQTANNANDLYAIRINVLNAGAGNEYAIYFDGAEIVSSAVGGTQDKKVRCSVNGTDYFIPLHTA